ncbi:MAG: Imidazole glycerol phosphate synthase subunit HisF [Elusimicrobia bacterium]|nr:Imidazole glycerol phosphate synthase subunit HisF [Elusimicrobiota bacterium]
MNMNVRVIPRLDIKGPNLVKGIHLEGLRVLGKPEEFAKHYYETGADELIFMDVVASLFQRNSLLDIVQRTSSEIFIPLTVGGGLRTIEDIRRVLRAGADKVSLNTAAIARPEFIREAAMAFGSSTIVISIEAIKRADGSYEAFTDNGRESTGVDAVMWAKRVEELGAGEILLTSVDREGTAKGFDVELTRRVAELVSIPVIAGGGAGSTDHILEVIQSGWADAVSVASLFHYDALSIMKSHGHHAHEGNIEYLKKGQPSLRVKGVSIEALKSDLVKQGLTCRFEPKGTHATF